MGKTHFASNYLEQSLRTLDPKGHFTVISFDQIRKNCLDSWIKDNRGGKIDDGLKATSKELTSKWHAELQEALTKATRDKTAHYIYLDKNFPPAEFSGVMAAIKPFE